MQISLIAAIGKNLALGKNNQLLWHLPNDFKHFKSVTLDKPVIMGRKTFQSIGKALPKRKNIILTTSKTFETDNCYIAHSIDEALALCEDAKEVMIIGGGEIYRQFWHRADYLYLTIVDGDFTADTFFPDWQTDKWKVVRDELHSKDDNHIYSFVIKELRRTCN